MFLQVRMSIIHEPSGLSSEAIALRWRRAVGNDMSSLRIGPFGMLILYHLGMFHVAWGWHIKSAYRVTVLELPMRLSILCSFQNPKIREAVVEVRGRDEQISPWEGAHRVLVLTRLTGESAVGTGNGHDASAGHDGKLGKAT
jgi:hypothetical protein